MKGEKKKKERKKKMKVFLVTTTCGNLPHKTNNLWKVSITVPSVL